jgi:hypothetical protein
VRPVLHGDLVAAARALLAVAPRLRPGLARRMLRSAELADRHRRLYGRPHPRFGGGSLMAAAAAWPMRPEPSLDDPDYLECLQSMLAALRARSSLPDLAPSRDP